MTVAGGGLSLMKAMMSTGQDMRTATRLPTHENDSPIIIKSTEFFPLWGQSGVRSERGSWRDEALQRTGQGQSAGLKF